jgi:hypothetical protein
MHLEAIGPDADFALLRLPHGAARDDDVAVVEFRGDLEAGGVKVLL